MVLQGVVTSREAKGFFVELALKDKVKAFAPFAEGVEEGDLVLVGIVSVNASAKIVKCCFVSQDSSEEFESSAQALSYTKEVGISSVKPGFLVTCKVQKALDNGIKVTFLSGIEGTIFIDHLTSSPKTYKMGDKVIARVIEVDIITKKVCLSQKDHLVSLTPKTLDSLTIGQSFDRSVVSRILYGSSYMMYLGGGQMGFLHKTHAAGEDEATKNEELKVD